MAHHGPNKIAGRIQPRRHATTRNDPQPAQPQRGPPRIALATPIRIAPGIAPLPRHRGPPRIAIRHGTRGRIQRRLRHDERVLVEVLAQIEARVVDHVSLLHDVGAVAQLAPGRVRAQDLQLGVVVRVRRRRQPLQDAGLREEEAARAHAQERALFGWVFLLHLGEGFDERDGFGVGGEDVGAAAAGDDEDVVVFDVLVRVRVVHVGFDDEALAGGRAGLAGDDGDFECFGSYSREGHVSRSVGMIEKAVLVHSLWGGQDGGGEFRSTSKLTLVFGVMLSLGQDLQGTNEVHTVEVRVESK